MEHYCFVSWYLTERCNFRCFYCYIYNPTRLKKLLRNAKKVLAPVRRPRRHDLYAELDAVLDRFRATCKRVSFGFTGGEPLVYPRFIDICIRIASCEEFMIALDTNLSTANFDRFIEHVPPDKVEYIYSSLHAPERERVCGGLDSFIERAARLKNAGYRISVNVVMHPTLFERFERDFEAGMRRGVRFEPSVFVGFHDGKPYPESYSDRELELIRRYAFMSDAVQRAVPCYRGRPCKSGMSLIRIMGNGDVIRCAGDYTPLGNVFTGFALHDAPRPCIVDVCPCFSADRLFDEAGAAAASAPRAPLGARLRLARNKLRIWWDSE